jgi:hypothetical protein
VEDSEVQTIDGDGDSAKKVSRTTLVVSVLLAAVLAGVAGVVIGWKVEQQRVKDDLANIRPVGTVTALDDDSLTIELENSSETRTYALVERTTVDGELQDGATVFIRSWRGGDDGERQATKIVVLNDEVTAEEPADGS